MFMCAYLADAPDVRYGTSQVNVEVARNNDTAQLADVFQRSDSISHTAQASQGEVACPSSHSQESVEHQRATQSQILCLEGTAAVLTFQGRDG